MLIMDVEACEAFMFDESCDKHDTMHSSIRPIIRSNRHSK